MRFAYPMCVLLLILFGVFFEVAAHRSFLEERFTSIYNEKFWQWGEETVSGLGSSMEHTQTIRKELPGFFKKFEIRSLLDAACGDFNWMQHVVLSGLRYVGIDIVRSMIEQNQNKYADKNIAFLQVDITQDRLPAVDVILSRDCLAHLSFRDAFRVLRNFKKSGSKYLLATTYIDRNRVNKDISDNVGYDNYPINLENAPFNFPLPLHVIHENCPHVPVRDKCLALWKLEDLNLDGKSAVTYIDNWGGRLGDQLLMYVKTRWISHSKDIPFYYKPFKYSDQLMMHEMDEKWDIDRMKHFLYVENLCEQKNRYRSLYVNVENYIKREEQILYVLHYFFHPHDWGNTPEEYDSQEISMWKDMMEDQCFREELKKVICPRIEVADIAVPEAKITVAVHVRKGGGYDTPLLSLQNYENEKENKETICYCVADRQRYIDKAYPLKFPPDAFYITQIKRISKMFNHVPIYVHIFTDDQDPSALMKRYEKAAGRENVEFGCRKKNNHHEKNVLEDLFAMAKFDCLIRSGSNFPQIAELIGNHKVVIYPKSALWRSQLCIDEVGTTLREDS